MRTVRWLIVLSVLSFGCARADQPVPENQAEQKSTAQEVMTRTEAQWIEYVKRPDPDPPQPLLNYEDRKEVIWQVPEDLRTKPVVRAYLESRTPSLDTIQSFAERVPAFDKELAELAVSKQPAAALYLAEPDWGFGGAGLVKLALKYDKDLFAKADPQVGIHKSPGFPQGNDSIRVGWTPELAEMAFKANPEFAQFFPRQPAYQKYFSVR